MTKIDCRNLACPTPVLETKKALESLKIGEKLSILLNSQASKENVLRFLSSQGLKPEFSELEGEFEIVVLKENNKASSEKDFVCSGDKNAPCKKILFLKADSVGNGELGKKLIVGFLDTLKSADNAPNTIICVNEAVLINTNAEHAAHKAMKELENKGIEVISCGSCLEFYGKTKDLKLGRIGNALEILNLLFDKDKVVGL